MTRRPHGGGMRLIEASRRGEVSSPGRTRATEIAQERRKGQCTDAVASPIPGTRGLMAPLTLGEAAAYLNLTERYMRRLVSERRIPYLKVGRLLRFRAEDLDAYLEQCRVEPMAQHPLLRERRR